MNATLAQLLLADAVQLFSAIVGSRESNTASAQQLLTRSVEPGEAVVIVRTPVPACRRTSHEAPKLPNAPMIPVHRNSAAALHPLPSPTLVVNISVFHCPLPSQLCILTQVDSAAFEQPPHFLHDHHGDKGRYHNGYHRQAGETKPPFELQHLSSQKHLQHHVLAD